MKQLKVKTIKLAFLVSTEYNVTMMIVFDHVLEFVWDPCFISAVLIYTDNCIKLGLNVLQNARLIEGPYSMHCVQVKCYFES